MIKNSRQPVDEADAQIRSHTSTEAIALHGDPRSPGGRSALTTKTVRDMGMTNVAHIAGGFAGWKAPGGPVGDKENKS